MHLLQNLNVLVECCALDARVSQFIYSIVLHICISQSSVPIARKILCATCSCALILIRFVFRVIYDAPEFSSDERWNKGGARGVFGAGSNVERFI
jgi:hypothetical protein